MSSAIVWTPKRHFLTSQPVFWAISREIRCTGYCSERVRGKNKNKKERPYISRISPGAPLRPIGTSFGLRVRLVDVINCAKLYRNRLRVLNSVRGRILTIPIGLRCRRQHCSELAFPLWFDSHAVLPTHRLVLSASGSKHTSLCLLLFRHLISQCAHSATAFVKPQAIDGRLLYSIRHP